MGIALKIKRAETPFYAGLKRLALSLIHFDLPFWRPWGLFLRANLRHRRNSSLAVSAG